MRLIINREEGGYFCYKNLKNKDQKFDFRLVSIGGWMGFRWAWSPENAEIFDNNNKKVCRFSYKLKFFSKALFDISLYENDKEIKIECVEQEGFRDLVFNFKYNGDNYLFHSYRNNYRVLYRNNIQVASFDSNYVHFFNRETFTVLAERDVSIPLLFCFSVFDDLAKSYSGGIATADFGNVIGTKPPDNSEWSPTNL